MKIFLLIFVAFAISFSSCKNKDRDSEMVLEVEKGTAAIKFDLLEDAVLAGGSLFRRDSFPTQLITPRTIDVWVPEGYSEEKKYAVLYMHDGQNLFDATTTWNEQEWMVDEIGTLLMNSEESIDFIVVGIHNVSEIRHADYFPKKAFELLPPKAQDSLLALAKENNSSLSRKNLKADDYLKFIVEELKPVIDQSYSTYTTSDHTAIAGSSMGALISMYAICEYPEVFGGAACISTHWPGVMPAPNNPVPQAFYEYLDESLPKPGKNKFYFDYGTETLDAYYPPFKEPIDSIFKSKGYTDIDYRNLEFEGEDHSEASWQKRFDIPIRFLFNK